MVYMAISESILMSYQRGILREAQALEEKWRQAGISSITREIMAQYHFGKYLERKKPRVNWKQEGF